MASIRQRAVQTNAVRAVLRVDMGPPFVGVISTGRGALRWRPRWSLWVRRARWAEVDSCVAGPDRRLGVERHSHRLVLDFDGGLLEVLLRGPWGALALVELRDTVRARAQLVADAARPGRFVRGADATTVRPRRADL